MIGTDSRDAAINIVVFIVAVYTYLVSTYYYYYYYYLYYHYTNIIYTYIRLERIVIGANNRHTHTQCNIYMCVLYTRRYRVMFSK